MERGDTGGRRQAGIKVPEPFERERVKEGRDSNRATCRLGQFRPNPAGSTG
jgi:hypothetical protein